jgi:hypothetical protein
LSLIYPATTRAPSIPNGIAAWIMQAGHVQWCSHPGVRRAAWKHKAQQPPSRALSTGQLGWRRGPQAHPMPPALCFSLSPGAVQTQNSKTHHLVLDQRLFYVHNTCASARARHSRSLVFGGQRPTHLVSGYKAGGRSAEKNSTCS